MAKAGGTIRPPRAFTPELTADAARLVLAGTSASRVAKPHDLTETALREWVKKAEAGSGAPSVGVLATEEREELARLRREVKQLRVEREILQAAATFFAKENAPISASSARGSVTSPPRQPTSPAPGGPS
jgi:transposase